jgi:erythromycin esterase
VRGSLSARPPPRLNLAFGGGGMDMATNASVATRIAEQATPLRLDLDAPFDDLAQLANRARDATVVALGSATRQSHELSVLTHRVMRFLLDEHGFRSLALEGDEAASIVLDTYVRTGEGNPLAILAGARPFWRLAEILTAVRWLRARNERNPSDPVRVVHGAEQPREAMGQLVGSEDVERRLAQITIAWHEQTGDRIVYWGGLAHTVNRVARSVSFPSDAATGQNAGSYLRERLGSGYVSIGLTFHHGSLPSPVEEPPADYVEAVLGAVGLEMYLIQIHGTWPDPVREWLDMPAKIRLIGPGTHELSGASLSTWFDFVIHSRRVTPALFL